MSLKNTFTIIIIFFFAFIADDVFAYSAYEDTQYYYYQLSKDEAILITYLENNAIAHFSVCGVGDEQKNYEVWSRWRPYAGYGTNINPGLGILKTYQQDRDCYDYQASDNAQFTNETVTLQNIGFNEPLIKIPKSDINSVESVSSMGAKYWVDWRVNNWTDSDSLKLTNLQQYYGFVHPIDASYLYDSLAGYDSSAEQSQNAVYDDTDNWILYGTAYGNVNFNKTLEIFCNVESENCAVMWDNVAFSPSNIVDDVNINNGIPQPTSEPQQSFFNNQYSDFIRYKDEKFPALGQIGQLFEDEENALSSQGEDSPYFTIAMFGSGDIPVFSSSALSSVIPDVKNFVGIFLWFYCAVYSYRMIHAYFHPGQLKLDI